MCDTDACAKLALPTLVSVRRTEISYFPRAFPGSNFGFCGCGCPGVFPVARLRELPPNRGRGTVPVKAWTAHAGLQLSEEPADQLSRWAALRVQPEARLGKATGQELRKAQAPGSSEVLGGERPVYLTGS